MDSKLEMDGFFPKHVQPGAVIVRDGVPLLVVANQIFASGNEVPFTAFYTVDPENARAAFSAKYAEFGVQHRECWGSRGLRSDGQDYVNNNNENILWDAVADPKKLEIKDYPEFSAIKTIYGWEETRDEIKRGAIVGSMVKNTGGRRHAFLRGGQVVINTVAGCLDIEFNTYNNSYQWAEPIIPQPLYPPRERLLKRFQESLKAA